MDDRQFQQLLDFLRLSWRGYRKVRKGVKKRVTRHMHELGWRNMKDYLKNLEED
jgi:chemotaxis protein methyltransferase CheR